MRRTVEIRNGYIYYGGMRLGWLMKKVRLYFNLPRNGRVAITIKKGSFYKIMTDGNGDISFHHKNEGRVGYICVKRFQRLFFRPDGRKRYDITVRKVKK